MLTNACRAHDSIYDILNQLNLKGFRFILKVFLKYNSHISGNKISWSFISYKQWEQNVNRRETVSYGIVAYSFE